MSKRGITIMYNVIVVGLGVYGSSVVHEAACRGLSVLGLDQYTVPHDNGSSHGGSRIFRFTTLESASYYQLATRAAQLWKNLDGSTTEVICIPTGLALIGRDGTDQHVHHGVSDAVGRAVDAARHYRVGHDCLSGSEFMSRYSTLQVGKHDSVFVEHDAFVIRPEQAINQLLILAQSKGATVQTSATVTAVKGDLNGPAVVVDGNMIRAQHVVLCTGPWKQKQLLGRESVESVVLPQVSLCAKIPQKNWSALPYPSFVYLADDGSLAYGVPPIDVIGEAKISIEQSKVSIAAPDVGLLPNRFISDQAEAARHAARQLVPNIDFIGARVDVCYYTTTWNSQLMVERSDDHLNVTTVSACSGHGFKYAPAIAERIIDGLELPQYSLADDLADTDA